jgi:quinol monooxygenase YgiN
MGIDPSVFEPMKLLRIVRLEFKPEHAGAFGPYFSNVRQHIAAFPGCMELSYYRDAEHANVFYTYSVWQRAEDLEAYRKSEFFAATWKTVKPFFAAPAQAFSLVAPDEVPSEN